MIECVALIRNTLLPEAGPLVPAVLTLWLSWLRIHKFSLFPHHYE
jgi:hypothetical protein